MARFRDIIRNGPLARATQGNPWPLVAQTVGGALGGPLLGQVAGSLVGRYQDRRDRRNAVPFSPSPEQAMSPQGLRDELGLTNWSSPSSASPAGQYGPMASGYAGLPQQPATQDPTYDPNFTQSLVEGYESAPLMGPRAPYLGMSADTRGSGVQSTTDIAGTLENLNFFGNDFGSGQLVGNPFARYARQQF